MVNAIYKICKANRYSSVSFSGLLKDDFVFTPVTFAFSYKDGELYSYKLVHGESENYVEESSLKEFFDFYEQRYEDVKGITLARFDNIEEQRKDEIFEKIVEQSSNKWILGYASPDINTNDDKLLNSYLQEKICNEYDNEYETARAERGEDE